MLATAKLARWLRLAAVQDVYPKYRSGMAYNRSRQKATRSARIPSHMKTKVRSLMPGRGKEIPMT